MGFWNLLASTHSNKLFYLTRKSINFYFIFWHSNGTNPHGCLVVVVKTTSSSSLLIIVVVVVVKTSSSSSTVYSLALTRTVWGEATRVEMEECHVRSRNPNETFILAIDCRFYAFHRVSLNDIYNQFGFDKPSWVHFNKMGRR